MGSDLLNRGKWGVVDRHSFTSVDGYKKVVPKGLECQRIRSKFKQNNEELGVIC